MDFDDFDIDYEEGYEEPGYAPDRYFIEAKKSLKQLFDENKEDVFYLRQLQIKYEKRFFHWITNNAITSLYKDGEIKDLIIPREKGTSTRYFHHKSNRYPKRRISKIEKIIEEYSRDHITRSCGHRAEDLFCSGLAMKGFMPIQKKVKEYDGNKWSKTEHDLDFIFKRDAIAYGCEIKNTLRYIDLKELKIKLEMCEHFRVKPLFVLRYAPTTYINEIYKQGGYTMIFECQIYELSQIDLVNRIKHEIGLPVDSPKAIPDGILERFRVWHEKKL
jgi:hypothetical protein